MTLKTITEEYRHLQTELHINPNYGIASLSFAPLIADFIKLTKVKSISDYGAGKQHLKVGLDRCEITGVEYYPYDPAFPEYVSPKEAELVCCIDVLEHVEPELIKNVIHDLASILFSGAFFQYIWGLPQKYYLMVATRT